MKITCIKCGRIVAKCECEKKKPKKTKKVEKGGTDK